VRCGASANKVSENWHTDGVARVAMAQTKVEDEKIVEAEVERDG
jgi:hypothetical protein